MKNNKRIDKKEKKEEEEEVEIDEATLNNELNLLTGNPKEGTYSLIFNIFSYILYYYY